MIAAENSRLWIRKAEEEGETRVSHVCGHNHPRSTHIDDGDVSYGSLYLSTRTFLDARGSLATCYINVPMINQNLSSRTFLV